MRRPESPADVIAWLVVIGVALGLAILAWPLLAALVIVVALALSVGHITYPWLFPQEGIRGSQGARSRECFDELSTLSGVAQRHWSELPPEMRVAIVRARRLLVDR